MNLLVLFQKILYQIGRDDIFFEAVSTCRFVFDCANYFGQCLRLTSVAVTCYCFLCHDELGLLDFLVNGVLLQDRIVFLQFHSCRSISPVLGRDISGSSGLSRLFVLGALKNHLNSISLTFLSHENKFL